MRSVRAAVPGRVKRILQRARSARRGKGWHELEYWRSKQRTEGVLGNGHFERLYTDMFGVDRAFYAGQRILDIGCGPRGSLEWATDAAERVGLDPLADAYRELGIDRHAMQYVAAASECIPFPDAHFDIITSLNSLDHVDDLEVTLREIGRTLRSGGHLMVEVEIGHEPTPTEPVTIWLDFLGEIAGDFDVVSAASFELPGGLHDVHGAWSAGQPFDESAGKHPGVLVARLRRV